MTSLRLLTCVTALFIAQVAAGQGARPSVSLAIVDPSRLDVNRIDWAYRKETTASLSRNVSAAEQAGPTRVGSTRFAGDLVGTVSIRTELLVPPRPGDAIFSFAPPRGTRHVALVVDGQEYILEVLESRWDAAFEVRHATAAIVSHSSGYARFTIDDRTGLLVGTLRTPRGLYRFVPGAAERTQLVFLVRSDRDTPTRGDRGVRIEDARIQRMERRHAQVEVLAKLQPSVFQMAHNELTVVLFGTELGRVDYGRIAQPNEILRLLRGLSALTHTRGDEQLVVESVEDRSTDGQTSRAVSFRQEIGGIPVRRPQEVVVGIDGRVLRLRSSMVDPAIAPSSSTP